MFSPTKNYFLYCLLISIAQLHQGGAGKSASKPLKLQMANIQSESSQLKETPKKRQKSKPTAKTKRKRSTIAKKTPAKLSAKLSNHCTNLYKSVSVPFKNLLSKADPGAIVADNTALFSVTRMQPKDCYSKLTVKNALKDAYATLNNHNVKIGVILPLTGPKSDLSTFILQGIKASVEEAGLDYKTAVIIKDDRGDPSLTEKKLSELVFRDKVTTVVGGLDESTATVLAKWADQTQISTFLLTRNREIVKGKTHAFRIYPDQKRLAASLAHTAGMNNFKKVAILRPANQKSDQLSKFFTDSFSSSGGRIVNDFIYTPNNFDSMNAIVRQLFQIDTSTRRGELKRAYDRQRRLSAAEGVPFNPRMVSLRPIVDFDAVFIPDDFRTVKYFAKLFKFHGVQKIGLLGNHEWRSPALVYPWDDILENAIFADFIGNYTEIPKAIAAPTVGSPYFVHANDVVPIDFRLIGYKAGMIAAMALKNPRVQRRLISKAFENLASTDPKLFGTKNVFAKDHTVSWPTFTFKIENKHFRLEHESFDTKEAKTSNRNASKNNSRLSSTPFGAGNSSNKSHY